MKKIELTCTQISREVWEEREYRFEKSSNLAREDFEAMAKVVVGWDEGTEMEIKFHYMLNDTMVFVEIRERIE